MSSIDLAPLRIVEATPRVSGSRVGAIVAMRRCPIVDFAGNPLGPQPARVVASLSSQMLATAYDAGLPVLLVFDSDDPSRPVIVDVVVADPPAAAGGLLPAQDDRVPEARVPVNSEQAGVTACLARIVGVEADVVLVETDTGGAPAAVRTAVTLRNLKDPVVLLVLPDGSGVIVGQVYAGVPVAGGGGEGAEVLLKGNRVRIEADVELILTAGACTVRLDARGRAVTTADQIVSRARGCNKVQGGSVQLN